LSKLFRALVQENEKLAQNLFLITLKPLEKIQKPEPGQFFMLSTDNGFDPLLKRPFSIHRWFGSDLQLLYRVIGKATTILKGKKPGTSLELLGPLGNGFPAAGAKTRKVLVAGGIGIAPIFALAETLAAENPLVFIGARNQTEVLCIDKLKSLGITPVISTDDGSLGKKGFVTGSLKGFFTQKARRASLYRLYACGPRPMLKEMSRFMKRLNLRGYLSLEENMACGLGACLSCIVNTKRGVKRVCREGPVFKAEEIIW
jgi:dihydroorotate dehydrogenase electron transfer subunit